MGTKTGALLGVKHGKEGRLRTSVRKESEGRDGAKVKQLNPMCN